MSNACLEFFLLGDEEKEKKNANFKGYIVLTIKTSSGCYRWLSVGKWELKNEASKQRYHFRSISQTSLGTNT